MPNESLISSIFCIIKRHVDKYGSSDIVALSIDCMSVDIICSDPKKSSSTSLAALAYGLVLSADIIMDASAQIIKCVESIMSSFKFMIIDHGYMSLVFLPVGRKYTIEHGGDGDLLMKNLDNSTILSVCLDAVDNPSDAFWKLIEDNGGILETLKCYKHVPNKSHVSKQVTDKMKEYYSKLSDADKLMYELDV